MGGRRWCDPATDRLAAAELFSYRGINIIDGEFAFPSRIGRSMGIKFLCPHGHKLNVKSFLAGKKGVCPECGERFVVPLMSTPNQRTMSIGQSQQFGPGHLPQDDDADDGAPGPISPAANSLAPNSTAANSPAAFPGGISPAFSSAAASPAASPSAFPAGFPSAYPSAFPSASPNSLHATAASPTASPTGFPTSFPTAVPANASAGIPAATPTATPNAQPMATVAVATAANMPAAAAANPANPLLRTAGAAVPGFPAAAFGTGIAAAATPNPLPGAYPFPGLVPGASPGANSSAMPGAMPGALPSANPRAIPGTIPGALPGATPSAIPGAMPGAMPNAIPGAMPGVTPGVLAGAFPGVVAGGVAPTPSAVPHAFTGALPTSLPLSPMPAAPTPAPLDPLVEAPQAKWYVRPPAGGQFGPADAVLMRQWIGEGRVSAESMVWREGWSDWKKAGGLLPGVAGTTAAAPSGATASGATASAGGQLLKGPDAGLGAGHGLSRSLTSNASASPVVDTRANLPRPKSSHWGLVFVLLMAIVAAGMMVVLVYVIRSN